MKSLLHFGAAFLLLASASIARAGDTARVLFIGNSFTGANDLPETFRLLAASAGGDVVIKQMEAPGGTTFQYHSTAPATLAAIDAGGWDFVVLQEQSQRPAFPDAQVQQDVYPYAKILAQRVKQFNPCARVIFYNTWGYKNGDASNCPFFTPLCTYTGMDSLLRLRYRNLADSNDSYHCPVGPVWRYIRANAQAIELFDADGMHPSVAGTYAAACAFYAVVFGKSPALATYVPAGLPAPNAVFIRQFAKTVAFDSLAYWRQLAAPLPAPTAAFTHFANGLAVAFSSTSIGATQYSWSFGDGGTATAQAPPHTYSAPGTYTVKLVVRNSCKVADSVTRTVTVSTVGIVTAGNAFADAVLAPNPATNQAVLHGLSGEATIELRDVRGALISRQYATGHGDVVLSLATLPRGLYVVCAAGARGGQRVWKLARQ